jgi:hypothetical protein
MYETVQGQSVTWYGCLQVISAVVPEEMAPRVFIPHFVLFLFEVPCVSVFRVTEFLSFASEDASRKFLRNV